MNSASTTTHSASPDQERLARILDEYLVAIEQGQCVSPDELLAKYPDDAVQLRGYLSGLQLFHAAAIEPNTPVGTPREVGVPAGVQSIGDYRLVREIGRGGMGVVYEAWQVSLRRRVALKVLPFTSSHDAKHISRFKNEAQAAAQAQHPNIVPVFAIGEEAGTHYYVMQLIEGQSLTALLAALRNGGTPRCATTAPNYGYTYGDSHAEIGCGATPAPSTETISPMRASETADHIRVVARLGIQAAEALHAAHEIGIVHRDVKPSNLLLDDQGKLWITDFGLARCRENPGLTQTGDILGTMRYTSPEQALGRTTLVDHRSDLYSLGLTMYELATLNHPADEVSDVQLLFDRNRPPVKPLRHWNRNIPRDFETIVLKCMSEFPHERYGSAREFAEDLERFLDGRPIVASPPGLVTRATKWAKRRRGVVYAVAAVLLVAAAGLIANNLMLAQEKLMLARETAAKDQALVHAKEQLRESFRLLDSFATDYSDQLAGVPGAEALRQQMIQDCIARYHKFEDEAHNDPSLAEDMAVAYGRLGSFYEKLGERAEAISAWKKSLAIWQDQVVLQRSGQETTRSVALAKNSLGLLLSEDGKHAEGLQLLRDALGAQQSLRSERNDWRELKSDLAATHSNIGVVLRRTGKQGEAAKEFLAAIDIAEPLATSAAVDETAARGVAAAYYNLASVREADDVSASAAAYRKAIGYQRQLVEQFPIKRFYQADLARSYNELGRVSSQKDSWELTERCFADAIRIQENLVNRSPLSGTYRRDLAFSYNNLGLAQARSHRFVEAEGSFHKAIALQDTLLAVQPADAQLLNNQGNVWNNLASLLNGRQRPADAAEAYRKSISFKQKALNASPADAAMRVALSDQYHKYAANLAAQGKYDDVISVTIDRGKLWPGNAEQLYSTAQDLAGVYRRMKSEGGQETSKTKCVEAAASLLRDAIANGLARDRLLDRSLGGLVQDVEFGKLIGVKTNELTQAN